MPSQSTRFRILTGFTGLVVGFAVAVGMEAVFVEETFANRVLSFDRTDQPPTTVVFVEVFGATIWEREVNGDATRRRAWVVYWITMACFLAVWAGNGFALAVAIQNSRAKRQKS